ncbi:MAG: hypothetical protein NZM25_09685 [Leptospiraceae bacterium]|nr:hypothetical protein [Leptospiraceae bacterium]MDW8306429.1 hypothetical protein [Leptospiraceae bacterium]
MRIKSFFLGLVLLNLSISPEEKDYISFDFGLDPYYSSAGIIFSFWGEPIPILEETPEKELYTYLLRRSFLPSYLLLEASVYPLPLAGVAVRQQSPEIYAQANITDSFNLVKTVTAGFEEPYSVSLFLGNLAIFRKTGEQPKARNLGYMGYLFSYGNFHIKDNVLIDDHWFEVEWKMKGERIFEHSLHNWSFRVGTKVHSHPHIADVIYLSLRRNRIDFLASLWSFFENSGIEYIFDLSIQEMAWMRHFFLAEKNFPYKEPFVFILGLGFNYEANRKYTGPLADRRGTQNFQVLIRPNVRF